MKQILASGGLRVMKRALAVLLGGLLALPASAAVVVSYGDPRRFTDAEDRSTTAEDAAFALARQLELAGDRLVDPATDLHIRIVDLDRAGSPRMNFPSEIRVMTGTADFPCVELSYSWSRSGSRVVSGRERVCDVNYLRRAELHFSSTDPMVYEKRMLTEWLRARFGAPEIH
jgi:hypothetical protein